MLLLSLIKSRSISFLFFIECPSLLVLLTTLPKQTRSALLTKQYKPDFTCCCWFLDENWASNWHPESKILSYYQWHHKREWLRLFYTGFILGPQWITEGPLLNIKYQDLPHCYTTRKGFRKSENLMCLKWFLSSNKL